MTLIIGSIFRRPRQTLSRGTLRDRIPEDRSFGYGRFLPNELLLPNELGGRSQETEIRRQNSLNERLRMEEIYFFDWNEEDPEEYERVKNGWNADDHDAVSLE
jgi:hypothetical protein